MRSERTMIIIHDARVCVLLNLSLVRKLAQTTDTLHALSLQHERRAVSGLDGVPAIQVRTTVQNGYPFLT
jgi:hypothetical protein